MSLSFSCLAERREDIEPNIDYLLRAFGTEHGQMVRFNKEARDLYMRFALSLQARWTGNFRDLSASVMRMATLAEAGRVTIDIVDGEILRLRRLWQHDAETPLPSASTPGDAALKRLLAGEAAQLDHFDAVQLQAVIDVCCRSASLSEAGRSLFAVSRQAKRQPNDADRLKKYLARFGLSWEAVRHFDAS